MFVGIGWYRAVREMYIHGRYISQNMRVYVPQVIVNEDLDLSSATIRINKTEEFRIPIKEFLKQYEYCQKENT